MASYHLTVKIIGRSQGRSAVASAAYRSRSKIRDVRQSLTFDYSKRKDLAHAEIMLPKTAPKWMENRSQLWNAVEKSEIRKDAQLAREIEIALPLELKLSEQIDLVKDFCKTNFTDNGMIADICIHDKENNPHAHIMLTKRDVDKNGFGKKNRDWDKKELLLKWREQWANVHNFHLAKAGFDISVDHRSYKDRGIDIIPQVEVDAIKFIKENNGHDQLKEYHRIAKENGDRIIIDPNIALDFLTKQQATFSRKDIYKFVHSHTDSEDQFYNALKSIDQSKDLVLLGKGHDGEDRFTSKEMLQMEREMLDNAETISKNHNFIIDAQFIEQAKATRTLSEDQLNAFDHIVNGGDIVSVVGHAGTGKSYMLGAVREAYESDGYKVVGMALSGIAAESLKESGIDSDTIHKRLYDWEKGNHQPDENTVIVVDEAGMVGTRQMHLITEYARRFGAKLVLSGDYLQLQPIEAGGASRAIGERIGYAEMVDVRRQEVQWQKEATILLSGSYEDVAEAIDKYDEKGRVWVNESMDEAKDRLVADWEKSLGTNEKLLMLAFQNKDVNDLNHRARLKMIEKGLLKEGKVFSTPKGRKKFSSGDRIIFLDKERSLGVKNSTTGTVQGIRGRSMSVRLDSGRTIVFDATKFNKFDHGYAVTVHRSQGATVDRSFVLGSKYFDQHMTYVSLSRHKKDVNLYVSRDEDGFKDYAHMKLLMGRNRQKQMIHEFALPRGIEVDLKKIYQWKSLEISLTDGDKVYKKPISSDPRMSYAEQATYLKDKAREFGAEIDAAYNINYKDAKLTVYSLEDPEDNKLTIDRSIFHEINQGKINLIADEMDMLDNIEMMAKTHTHDVSPVHIASVSRSKKLSEDQQEALKYIVNGGNLVSLTGYSGSGKSYLLSAVNDIYQKNGFQVMGLSGTNVHAGNLKNTSGIETKTIHSLLSNIKSGKTHLDENTVLIIDEAASINSKKMAEVVSVAEKEGTKLVLSTNLNQHQSTAVRTISEKTGSFELTNVKRQSIEWQQKVTALLSGSYEDVAEAINVYDAKDKVRMEETLDDAKKKLVSDWSQEKEERLIIAFRNKDVADLNQMARASMQKAGKLKGESQAVDTVKGKAEFSVGDRILFLKSNHEIGVTAGSLASIEKIADGKINARLDSGSVVTYDINKFKNFTHGYAAGLNNTQNIEVKNTFVLGTRHFDRHMANIALSRHKDDMKLYVSRDSDGFKDFAHMKLLMARSREKHLISEADMAKEERIDLGKIYKWDQYEILFGSGPRPQKKTVSADPGLSLREKKEFLENRAREFAAGIVREKNIKNSSGYRLTIKALKQSKDIPISTPSVFNEINQGKINIIAGERDMIENAEIMAETHSHTIDSESIQAIDALKSLSKDQRDAFDAIINGGDMVSLTGHAGTGKSYLLSVVKEAYEKNDHKVIGLASSVIGAGNMKSVTGIESGSTYHFLKDLEKGNLTLEENTVLIMDEASSINSKEMAKIVAATKDFGGKMVLSSNLNQNQPMEHGTAARSLTNEIGAIELTDVMRHEAPWQKEATTLLSGSYEEVSEAIDLYSEHNKIQMEKTLSDAKNALIAEWETQDQPGLIIAFRNKDVADLNQMARASMQKAGELKGERKIIDTVKGKAGFSVGDRIIFLKDNDQMGLTAGSLGSIENISGNEMSVRMDSGKVVVYDTNKYKNFTHGYALGLNNTQNIEAEKTFVLGTRHFDRHLTNLALSRHTDDMKLYVSCDGDGFKDYAHMKLLMVRDYEKSFISDVEKEKKPSIDISKIYKWDKYKVVVRHGLQTFKKELTTDPRLGIEERRQDLSKKAIAFAEGLKKQYDIDPNMLTIKTEFLKPAEIEKTPEIEKSKTLNMDLDGPSM